MTEGVKEQLFGYLANRYRDARTNVDELRQRALELVIAGCVAETATLAVGEIPPPRPDALAEDSVDAASAAPDEQAAAAPDEPKPRPLRGPDPVPPGADLVTEEAVVEERTRDPEPAEPAKPPEPRIVPDPNISTEPPPGPNRGFWGPPQE